ncbi:Glutathione S-transferase Mu 3 [Liparis tanakae]|uniref:Glutathione S-transferase Mu 3 n=1 Tax=Liparis tanakae TaxID=230148 RepID=A0A4Z2IY83_9TELE|nr:Glutathione S-transferase Mu 3 [Liparis tanakae]
MTMKLAYWDIRGLAQPARLLLEYTGSKYEDKLYVCGEGGETEDEKDNLKPGYLQKLPGLLKQFSNYLGVRKWFAGDKALEKIAAYLKSDRFKKTPVNNKMANWGNKRE